MRCYLCPVRCGADRDVRAGACGVKGLSVAKAYLHPYEEPFLSPRGKSGAVFFAGCSLKCAFCQNFGVSRAMRGRETTPRELSDLFRALEAQGAENIDLVTPDHAVEGIAEAMSLYRPKVPVVFNSGGYVTVEALEKIDPWIDVYLPDFKFASPALAKRLTGREDYPAAAAEAVAFMAKKKPAVRDGQLIRGIAVRHLVLPAHTEDSKRVLDALAALVDRNAPLSIMRQYTPMGEIGGFPELNRPVSDREYQRVVDYALSLGFTDLYTQDASSADPAFIPDWDG